MGIKSDAINRLFNAYGKEITTQRMYYYEEWAKSVDPGMVSRVIDEAVKQEQYLPTVNKLYELTIKMGTSVSTQSNVYYCDTCRGAFTVVGGICPICGNKGV